ncbi:MAG: hypothetical protein JWQ45_1763 [Blastococcus sp.]|nr:hypothetical protein [Blastococcus sp.]
MRRASLAAGAAVLTTVLLSGCGSGAVTSPESMTQPPATTGPSAGSSANSAGGSTGDTSGTGSGTGSGAGSGAGSGTDAPEFVWSLPSGDPSVGTAGEIHGYQELLHRCAGAAAWVQENWPSFDNPRNVLVYLAAGYTCRGDLGQARTVQELMLDAYGLAALDLWPDVCAAYRATASVLAQAPPEGFDCPGGEPPPWRADPSDPLQKDNPITPHVDESGLPPTSEPPTAAPPTTEPPTSEPPTAAPPTTEPPTTEPTTEPPTTEPPITGEVPRQAGTSPTGSGTTAGNGR